MSSARRVATQLTSENQRRGFSLVEIIVSMTLLAVALMSLASASSLGLNQMGKARQDLQYSADVQQVVDSLVSLGWNKVTSGSTTIRGRAVSWTVTTVNANSQKLNVVVTRRGQAQTTMLFPDTVSIFLANTRLQ